MPQTRERTEATSLMNIQTKLSSIVVKLAFIVLLVGGAVLFAAFAPGIHIKWYLLVVMTVLTFAVVIGLNRQLWNVGVFWAAIVAICVLHLAVYASVLSAVERWPGALFVGVFVAEVIAVNIAVSLLLPRQVRR